MNSYSDGFFDVSSQHGFLPIRDPLSTLPERYAMLQSLITDLPIVISHPDEIVTRVVSLPDYSSIVSTESDIFIKQALFRAYTFVTSAYTLESSYQHFIKTGTYGKARQVLPAHIAKPLVIVSDMLKVYPWLDYHYAYSLGNYVKKNDEKSLDWTNLDMACSFTKSPDEVGFIMLHVYINELSPALVESVQKYREEGDSRYLQTCATVMHQINSRRREMWEASRHSRYNDFRVFIMGIKGNTDLFGEGLVYEGCFDDQPQQFRGQTGAQDNIIPMMDIFTGIVDHYPTNKLTEYLLDLRSYRPECIQRFFTDLRQSMDEKSLFSRLENDHIGLIYLLQIVDEVYLFRNGHWQFVQKYIMANTDYEMATGGTPIISWLINQIDAVLTYESILIKAIDRLMIDSDINDDIKHQTYRSYHVIKQGWADKKDILLSQIEELKKKNYNVDTIYNKNKEVKLDDQSL